MLLIFLTRQTSCFAVQTYVHMVSDKITEQSQDLQFPFLFFFINHIAEIRIFLKMDLHKKKKNEVKNNSSLNLDPSYQLLLWFSLDASQSSSAKNKLFFERVDMMTYLFGFLWWYFCLNTSYECLFTFCPTHCFIHTIKLSWFLQFLNEFV